MSFQIKTPNYWKTYYSAHREERKAQQRDYYWRNHNISVEKSKQYYEANRESRLEYHRNHYQENKERYLVLHKEYLRQNPQKRTQFAKNYRDSHQDTYREYQREYQYSDKRQLYRKTPIYKAKRQIITARYRARKNQLEATLTLEQWEAIKRIYNYRCAYCGRKPEILTQDHVIAVSKGGSYKVSNIVPACLSCNSSKGVNPPAIPVVKLLLL